MAKYSIFLETDIGIAGTQNWVCDTAHGPCTRWLLVHGAPRALSEANVDEGCQEGEGQRAIRGCARAALPRILL